MFVGGTYVLFTGWEVPYIGVVIGHTCSNDDDAGGCSRCCDGNVALCVALGRSAGWTDCDRGHFNKIWLF